MKRRRAAGSGAVSGGAPVLLLGLLLLLQPGGALAALQVAATPSRARVVPGQALTVAVSACYSPDVCRSRREAPMLTGAPRPAWFVEAAAAARAIGGCPSECAPSSVIIKLNAGSVGALTAGALCVEAPPASAGSSSASSKISRSNVGGSSGSGSSSSSAVASSNANSTVSISSIAIATVSSSSTTTTNTTASPSGGCAAATRVHNSTTLNVPLTPGGIGTFTIISNKPGTSIITVDPLPRSVDLPSLDIDEADEVLDALVEQQQQQQDIETLNVAVTWAHPAAFKVLLQPARLEQPVGQPLTVAAMVLDANKQPVVGATVGFTMFGGMRPLPQFSERYAVTDAKGVAVTTARGLVPGSVSLIATAKPAAAQDAGLVASGALASAPAHLTFVGGGGGEEGPGGEEEVAPRMRAELEARERAEEEEAAYQRFKRQRSYLEQADDDDEVHELQHQYHEGRYLWEQAREAEQAEAERSARWRASHGDPRSYAPTAEEQEREAGQEAEREGPNERLDARARWETEQEALGDDVRLSRNQGDEAEEARLSRFADEEADAHAFSRYHAEAEAKDARLLSHQEADGDEWERAVAERYRSSMRLSYRLL